MAENWNSLSERGSYFWVLLAAWMYKVLGRRVTLALLAPVIFFDYLTGRQQRRASLAYLRRAHEHGLIAHKPGFWSGYPHFMSFAGSLVDKLAGWTGKISADQVEGAEDPIFSAAKFNGKGGLVLTAHVGNPELIRAVATVGNRFAVTVIMHTNNAQQYNEVIRKFSPESRVSIIEVSQIDVSVAMRLSEAVERGEWVVMAADRLPPDGARHQRAAISMPFLGGQVEYPIGPYVLAATLKCPVYFLLCLRSKGKKPFKILFRHFADRITLPRGNREQALRPYMAKYSELLAEAVAEAPYQWFNFYDYWNELDDGASLAANASHPSSQTETAI